MESDLYNRFDGYDEIAHLLTGTDEDVLLALAGKPALLRLPAAAPTGRARLVACLLHGNEDSGYRAVLRLLRTRPRYDFDLWVFIGNVRAASAHGWFAHRFLDDQEDFNRVWGVEQRTTRMRRCTAAVLDELGKADLEAALDLHNNTGENPPHAIVPQWTPAVLHLAAVCTDIVLHWPLKAHTLMEALAEQCPTVAVECGVPGLDANAAYAAAVLQRFLREPSFDPAVRMPGTTYELRSRITVRSEVPFAFGGVLSDEVELVLSPGLDGHNFGMLLAGTELGRVHPGAAMPLCATDMQGRDVTDSLVALRHDGRLLVTHDVTPVMMTTTVAQTRRDCLFYVARCRDGGLAPWARPSRPAQDASASSGHTL